MTEALAVPNAAPVMPHSGAPKSPNTNIHDKERFTKPLKNETHMGVLVSPDAWNPNVRMTAMVVKGAAEKVHVR